MSKIFRNSMILTAVLLLLLGLTLIIWPLASQRLICYLVGAVCLIYGISRIVKTWRASRDLGFESSYLSGILVCLIGLLFLIKADALIAIFGTLIGIALTADSLVKLQVALQMKKFSNPRWHIHTICAAVLLVLGLVLLFDPFAGTSAIAIVSGIALVIDAAMNIWSVIEMRKNIV